MSRRYQIWNKQDNIITPIGEVLTPEQWIERYPMASVVDIVIGGGTINGACCMEYTSFVELHEKVCDFSECTTKQDYLDVIEAFEDSQRENQGVDTQTRIADALEDLIVLNMPDEEE